MGLFSKLFKKKEPLVNEELKNIKHDKKYEGITRPQPKKVEAIKSTGNSKMVFSAADVRQIASNAQIIREKQGLTQKQVAEKLGYKSASFVSRLELWEVEQLTMEQVEQLAAALGTTIDSLLIKTLK